MRVSCGKSIWLLVILVVSAEASFAQIRIVKAQTKDGLTIALWLSPEPAKVGQDVMIHYRISNVGSKTVYLVKKESLQFETASDNIIVNPFTVGFDEHGPTDYRFESIRTGTIKRGAFVIPGRKLYRDGLWFITVEFAFVNDVRRLQPENLPSRDPVAFRGLLAQLATPISLGKLALLLK